MDDQNLQNRVASLEKQMAAFSQPNTIPYEVDKAWQGRGFINVNNFFVFGSGELSGGGDYDLVIPNANKNSIPFVQPFIGGGSVALEAEIQESISSPGSYQLHVEGVATSEFYFVVFLFTKQWYIRN